MTEQLLEMKEQNITVEFDLNHIYKILQGLILLTHISADRQDQYIYSKMFISIQSKIHQLKLCKTPDDKCNFKESCQHFQDNFKDEIEKDFNRLLRLYN